MHPIDPRTTSPIVAGLATLALLVLALMLGGCSPSAVQSPADLAQASPGHNPPAAAHHCVALALVCAPVPLCDGPPLVALERRPSWAPPPPDPHPVSNVRALELMARDQETAQWLEQERARHRAHRAGRE
jgi:hypothetical protein